MRPTKMENVSIVGPKSRMDAVIQRLHDMRILHIDDYEGEYDAADLGNPRDAADELSDLLVKLRSLTSKLPETEYAEPPEPVDDVAATLESIGERIDEIESDLDELRASREEKQELLATLDSVSALGIELSDIQDYASIAVHIGTVDDWSFREALEDGRYELSHAGNLIGLFVDADLDIDSALQEAGFEPVDITPLKEMTGDVAAERERLQQAIQKLDEQIAKREQELQNIAAQWQHTLEAKREELSMELEKAEAPLRFATTESAFIAEGWVPAERLGELEQELEDATQGTVYIERHDTDKHEAPVEHNNPVGIRPMESLIKLYGTPSYTEIDPTILLLTFPLLFGFMLGDVGYGLTTLALFGVFYKKFPDTRALWVSMMYASLATIVFGLAYGEMFGFIIFGTDSILAEVFGLHIFSQIPVLFHRAHELSTVLTVSVAFGFLHVNFGFLVGMINEYLGHGLKEAILAKGSWLVIEAGAIMLALQGQSVSLPAQIGGSTVVFPSGMALGGGVLVAGVVMLFMGESIEGIVEIPALLSNILSYLRIFGVSIAVVSLALVVNQMAAPLFQSGNIVMIGLGVLVLVIGHTFNTFIKLMEAGLQGIRLHYVEFFTKFFHGGGEYYKPFGFIRQRMGR